MARKRKQKVELISLDKEFTEAEFKPKCFGNKEDYCQPQLCGDWYCKCTKKEESND